MPSYLRPAIDSPVFRDADGQVIDYGRRWEDSPPDDTYSIDRHPERFAPLHRVADALIAHLRAAFDVTVREGIEVADDMMHPHPHTQVVRAVRVQPNDPECAALTFVFTDYPGILLHAGLLHDFAYPSCGCEACDSEWTTEADGLERQVLAVAGGAYRESIGRGVRPWVQASTTYPNGSSTGESRAEDFPADRLAAAMPMLAGRTGGWAPWPPRR